MSTPTGEMLRTRDGLTFDFKNTRPVELTDYTLSMLGLAKEFKCFVAEDSPEGGEPDIKLYVRSVREGSIITDLVANAHNLLPIFDYVKPVAEFGLFLKGAISKLLKKPDAPPGPLAKHSLENLSQILEPVCKDSGSQLNISTPVNVYGNVTFNITSLEANAAQNEIRNQLEELKEPVTGYHSQVVMYLYQARNDSASRAGDRAIIESISKQNVKTIFASEALKTKVLHPDEGSPFDQSYIVDVDVETVHGKPALYKVKDVHGAIEQMRLPPPPKIR
jgi:hypothetical protein